MYTNLVSKYPMCFDQVTSRINDLQNLLSLTTLLRPYKLRAMVSFTESISSTFPAAFNFA